MDATVQLNKKYALDCQYLHLYFSGNGSINNQKLVEILASKNLEELKLIRHIYSALYNHDLLHLLFTAQRTNKFTRVAYLHMREPHERDAEMLRGALFGSSVDPDILTTIVCTRLPSDLRSVKQAYRARYNSNIEQDLATKTKGNLKEILLAILNSSGISGARVDMSMAMCDAKVIYEAMESGKSIDRKTIVSLLSLRSTGQLKAILDSYKQLYGHELFKSLKQEKCGEFGKILRIIIQSIQYPAKHFTKKLRGALRNNNAQEVLIQTIVTRSSIDIKEINNLFSAKTGWSLESLVRNEFNTGSSSSSGANTDKANGLAADFLIALLKH
ncbi:annexin D2-like [Tasmannia lanceolata]|uniref:annexin D2-like n=1 Tax=Tasmannia lanceolata TaxID=3420 RepID=UPI004064A3E1